MVDQWYHVLLSSSALISSFIAICHTMHCDASSYVWGIECDKIKNIYFKSFGETIM